MYRATGYACNDIVLVYIATGCASNDIDLGCTTIGNIEFTALHTWYLGMHVLYIVIGYASSDINHAVKTSVCTAIRYACSDVILAYTYMLGTLTMIQLTMV